MINHVSDVSEPVDPGDFSALGGATVGASTSSVGMSLSTDLVSVVDRRGNMIHNTI